MIRICLPSRALAKIVCAGFVLILMCLGRLAFGHDLTEKDLEFFEKRIRPILVEHCYECHAGAELSGGLSLESRQQMLNGGDSGAAIILEHSASLQQSAGDSLLLSAVEYQLEHLQMPPQGKLSQAAIEDLRTWIERGAPDPRKPPDSAFDSIEPTIAESAADFWAFQPVSRPMLPLVQNEAWLRSPVDAFILQRLESLDLEPAPQADRRLLIRRIYLDLIGLPPTAEEIEEFLRDSSSNAFRRLVDRLLASPQYGARWARHWLDVARYADSNGLDENMAYGNAWRYRDYVTHSFNTDKPYDRFIFEQVAGDLLPDSTPETKTATGFLALGAKVLAEPDTDKLVMDTIDEQIDTVGKTFLGLTLGCARCHDHKFDPVTQADYYGLAAIFKGTKSFSGERYGAIKYWYEHSFEEEDDPESLKKIEEQIAAAKGAANQFKSQSMTAVREEARRRAPDYLTAATEVSLGASLSEVSEVAEPAGLHPRILQHCRQHIENQREDPFFADWYRWKDHPKKLQNHYSELFAQVDSAFERLKQSGSEKQTLENPSLEHARQLRLDSSGFLAVPAQPEYAFDRETLSEYYRLMEVARVLESAAPDRAAAMGVADGEPHPSLPIHIRGSHLNLGEPVPRGLPSVMIRPESAPSFPEHQSGRLQLAEWLADSHNPLTARVIVNRIWGWHFGRPLVSSTENFGLTGQLPTHPELLDWLASYFMDSGWSIKSLHRMILNSSTYQMSSEHPGSAEAEAVDPQNDHLWKFRIQRLDAEQLRDSVLASSGLLDVQLDGKTLPLRNHQFVFDHTSIDHTRYDSVRRALYLPIIRNNLYPLFEQFDYPDPTMPTGWRQATTVAPQALLLMNSEFVMDCSENLAHQLWQDFPDPSTRLQHLYLRLFSREPIASERERCLSFVDRVLEERLEIAEFAEDNPVSGGEISVAVRAASPEVRAWAILVHSLIATNDFLYVR